MENNETTTVESLARDFALQALEQVSDFHGSDEHIDGDADAYRAELLDGDAEYFSNISAGLMDLGIHHTLVPAAFALATAAIHTLILRHEQDNTAKDHYDELLAAQDSIEQDEPTDFATTLLKAAQKQLKAALARKQLPG